MLKSTPIPKTFHEKNNITDPQCTHTLTTTAPSRDQAEKTFSVRHHRKDDVRVFTCHLLV